MATGVTGKVAASEAERPDRLVSIPGRAWVRDRVLGNLEAFAQGRDDAVEPVAVIVGGGPTGVEMAGALAELRNAGLPLAYPEVDPHRVRVVLVEMTDTVLGPFDPKLRAYAADALRKRGVELRLGVAVKEVRDDCVVLADGEQLPSARRPSTADGTPPLRCVACWPESRRNLSSTTIAAFRRRSDAAMP